MTSIPECCICQEDITSEQNRTTLGLCNHVYHSICFQAWAIHHTTCPLCRQNFGHQQLHSLPTLLALAVWLPMDEQLQRFTFSFAFIRLVLTHFNTSEFNTHKENIIRFGETLCIDNYRIPLLCYKTRSDFYKQLNVLKSRFSKTFTGSLERHPYVHHWKLRILSNLRASTFFLQKILMEPVEDYYQIIPQLPHIS